MAEKRLPRQARGVIEPAGGKQLPRRLNRGRRYLQNKNSSGRDAGADKQWDQTGRRLENLQVTLYDKSVTFVGTRIAAVDAKQPCSDHVTMTCKTMRAEADIAAMKRLALPVLCLLALASPALAQFPPPGIYACLDATGKLFGTLSLFVAGDYDFSSDAIERGQGQLASAGPSVDALSGPLADIHLKGSFVTDEYGETTFSFTTDKGALTCALPERS